MEVHRGVSLSQSHHTLSGRAKIQIASIFHAQIVVTFLLHGFFEGNSYNIMSHNQER